MSFKKVYQGEVTGVRRSVKSNKNSWSSIPSPPPEFEILSELTIIIDDNPWGLRNSFTVVAELPIGTPIKLTIETEQ